ncbi:MAG TPA: PLP-dependent aminotransferase family protein [Phenylobacterium sp.]|nr:PLP-dependent aminotransferase family protein [Phenylobacterium sp.]
MRAIWRPMRNKSSVAIADVAGLDVEGRDLDAQPLGVRVFERLRGAILDGGLAAGSRLPSSRVMALDLSVSRNTVEWAYAQLVAEGYVNRRQGAGSFVADAPPSRDRPPKAASAPHERHAAGSPRALSAWARSLRTYPGHRAISLGTAFTPSLPSLEFFPRAVWGRLMREAMRRPGPELWAYGPSNGLMELRAAIAAQVAAARGVRCSAEQVVVTTSTQQALEMAARLVTDPGDTAWVEDPGYVPSRLGLVAAGLQVAGVPIDAEGFDLRAALGSAPQARLAVVTPSHQYPLGVEMSQARREALLAWARDRQGWILEDDYDGDYRYSGRPLAALQAMDRAGRVIYVGTFNKTLFPGVRTAFAVVPEDLVQPMIDAKHVADGHNATLSQAALAEFIAAGHFATHLRRTRAAYDERRLALIEALGTLGDSVRIGPSDGGMHLTAHLTFPCDDRAIAAACGRRGVEVRALSAYRMAPGPPGLVLGYASASPSRIRSAMGVLREAVAQARAV